jgi:hypothetical protein
MKALSQTGKEGALRARYVTQLEQSEEALQKLAQQEMQLKRDVERVEQEIEQRLKMLESS